ncbi:MAG TPA: permease [Candidatus Xenobia bacterium]|nr:permease [Candidatus Xenobia bacterium]
MTELLWGGVAALKDYIALHVLTCLVPAFLLAGAMVTFVSRETILHYLGRQARKTSAFPLAAGSSFFVAACSCTVIPVASGLYYGGAGIGPAFILLWVAPAANILALIYTGAILGAEMTAARVVSALLMAFVVGAVMTGAFRREEQQREVALAAQPDGAPALASRGTVGLLILLTATLLAPNYLVREGPYLQKVYVWAAGTTLVALYAWRVKTRQEIVAWLKETGWFVRIIFPLLLLGVFIVGVLGKLLPQSWIQTWLGGNGLLASFLATLIGSVSYFATMTEAPFVDTLMKMGMGPGPALALLLTGPGLSLPNWLAIARVFGARKAVAYVATIIVLGTLVGWAAGQFYFS